MSEQKQQPIISIDHVSMRFNLAKEKHESLKEYFVALLHGGVRFDEFFALSDVSFDIMPGDFYGLIGLNGSGKSTLLKVISGVYKPSAGKVTVNGTIAPLIELGAGFDMDLTARENIYLNGTVLGYTPKYIDSKFDDIVEFSELQEFLDVPLKNYSSGMVARLAFAEMCIRDRFHPADLPALQGRNLPQRWHRCSADSDRRAADRRYACLLYTSLPRPAAGQQKGPHPCGYGP